MNNLISRETIDWERERSSRFIKITFGILTLACLALGLLVTRFAPLGLPRDTAEPLAMALLWAAIAATGVLYLWDHVYKRRC
jgi:hypothetical protein